MAEGKRELFTQAFADHSRVWDLLSMQWMPLKLLESVNNQNSF
jgi:hypothetical protein